MTTPSREQVEKVVKVLRAFDREDGSFCATMGQAADALEALAVRCETLEARELDVDENIPREAWDTFFHTLVAERNALKARCETLEKAAQHFRYCDMAGQSIEEAAQLLGRCEVADCNHLTCVVGRKLRALLATPEPGERA